MNTVLTEGAHACGFLISEANHTRSREQILVNVGENLQPGAVLGKITASGHYKAYDNAASDGSQTPAGILLAAVDATTVEKAGAAIVRDAEVNAAELVWLDSLDSGEQETAITTLRTLGIVTR
jgi:hypothetical protein